MSNPRRAKVSPALIAVAILAIIGVVMGVVQVSRTFDSRVATYREQQEAEKAAQRQAVEQQRSGLASPAAEKVDAETEVAPPPPEPDPKIEDLSYRDENTWRPSLQRGISPLAFRIVRPGQPPMQMPHRFEMKAGELTGRVTDKTSGEPLTNVTVQALDVAGTHHLDVLNTRVLGTAKTNSEGVYTLRAPVQGMWSGSGGEQWMLVVTSPDHAREYAYYYSQTPAKSPVNFTLAEPTVVSGTVIDESGSPMRGVNLVLHGGPSFGPMQAMQTERTMMFVSEYATTDSSGRFEFDRVPVGWKGHLEGVGAGHGIASLEVEAGATDVSLQLSRRDITIRGRVVDSDGEPIVTDVNFSRLGTNSRTSPTVDLGKVRTRQDGTFELNDLYIGKFHVRASYENIQPAYLASSGSANMTIDITSREPEEVVLTLPTRVDQPFLIVDKETKEPVPGLELNLSNNPQEPYLVRTNADGLIYVNLPTQNFNSMLMLPPDGYFLEYSNNPHRMMIMNRNGWINFQSVVIDGETPIVMELTRGLLLEGNFVDTDTGEKIKANQVTVNLSVRTLHGSSSTASQAALTEEGFGYRQTIVRDTSVLVVATSDDFSGSVKLDEIPADSEGVIKQDIPMLKLGTLSITVVDEKGVPVPDLPIAISNKGRSGLGVAPMISGEEASTKTNEDGILLHEKISAGNLAISIPEMLYRPYDHTTGRQPDPIIPDYEFDPVEVTLAPGGSAEVKIVAQKRNLADIAIRFVNEEKEPVSGIHVNFQFMNINGQPDYSFQSHMHFGANMTDSDGLIRKKLPVPPSTVYIQISVYSDQYTFSEELGRSEAFISGERSVRFAVESIPNEIVLVSPSKNDEGGAIWQLVNKDSQQPVTHFRYFWESDEETIKSGGKPQFEPVYERNRDGYLDPKSIENPQQQMMIVEELINAKPTGYRVKIHSGSLRNLAPGQIVHKVELMKTGSVPIRVVHIDTGKPLAKVSLRLRQGPSRNYGRHLEINRPRQSRHSDERLTEEDGIYLYEGLMEGEHHVLVDHEGFDFVRVDFKVPHTDSRPVEIALTPTGTITGVFVDHRDRPVSGGRIQLSLIYDYPLQPGQTAPHRSHNQYYHNLRPTNAEGRFEIKDVMTGLNRVQLTAPDGVSAMAEVNVESGKTHDIKVKLERPIELLVRVRVNDRTIEDRSRINAFLSIDETSTSHIVLSPDSDNKGWFKAMTTSGKVTVNYRNDLNSSLSHTFELTDDRLTHREEIELEDRYVNVVLVYPREMENDSQRRMQGTHLMINAVDRSHSAGTHVSAGMNAVRIGGLKDKEYVVQTNLWFGGKSYTAESKPFRPSLKEDDVYVDVTFKEQDQSSFRTRVVQ